MDTRPKHDSTHKLIIDTLAAIGVFVAAGVIQGRMCARVMTTCAEAQKAVHHAA